MSLFVHLEYITQVVTLSPEDFSGNHLLVQIIKLIHQIIIKKHSFPNRNPKYTFYFSFAYMFYIMW